MKNKNLYQILGLSENASKEEIKAAYRKLVRVYHPDINKTPEAENYFKLLNNAVETLLDDVKRLQYDTMIGISRFKKEDVKKEKPEQNAKTQKKGETKNEKQPEMREGKGKTTLSTDKMADFKSFYKNESLKNAYKQSIDREENLESEAPSLKIDGKDLETVVIISKEEAKRGTIRKINVLHTDKCPKCLGRRYINGSVCALCHGAGEKSEHKKMNVKIPAQIKPGTKMKIKNEGEYGKFGGKNGDLYLLIEIAPEKEVEINSNEPVVEVPIAPYQAVLGGKIEVSLEGNKYQISIPPLTKSLSKFKLNKGEKNDPNGLKSAYIVVLRVDIPDEITKEERELYQKLKIIAETK